MDQSDANEVPKQRAPLWRRALLLALEVNPPWYGRIAVWVLLPVILFTIFITTIPERGGQIVPFTGYQHPDGSWSLQPSDGAELRVTGSFTYEWGLGWRHVVAGPLTLKSPSGKGPVSPSNQQLQQLCHDGFEDALARQQWPPDTSDSVRDAFTTGVTMLRDGKASISSGHMDRMRLYFLWASIASLALILVVGNVRNYLRLGYQKRLELGEEGICPRCEYSLAGLPTGICPECGLDVRRAITESRKELRLEGRTP